MKEIEVKPMFEGQIHERQQFKVTIDGNDYQGIYHEGDIDWFHPHPENDLSDAHVDHIESQVHGFMKENNQ
ncbi:YheE family protein [Sporosarcina sp. Te-1]|uniref:YheE family protein n=1 Tax=Sporosarcina sp. Te-1 TaxID=2818390 RepID=UPI001FB10534|nr:YheE family protein [Sporosarcina sp. Te-1]